MVLSRTSTAPTCFRSQVARVATTRAMFMKYSSQLARRSMGSASYPKLGSRREPRSAKNVGWRPCMHPIPRKTLFAATLALALSGRPAPAEEPGGGRRPVLRIIAGTLTKLARAEGRLTVESGDDVVTLSFDRNTSVFLEQRLGSLGDLAVGEPVRASYGEDARAYWVEIRASQAML